MRWHCKQLNDGWVMIAVDVCLTDDNSPEAMAGLRYAVHPFIFDEDPEAFWLTISEMLQRAQAVAQPLPASRACAFGGLPVRCVNGLQEDVVAILMPAAMFPNGAGRFSPDFMREFEMQVFAGLQGCTIIKREP